VQTGDQTLISMNNRWYLVEKFDDADNNYQVEEFITKAEFEKVFKEIKANGRSGRIKSVQGIIDKYDKLNQSSYSFERRTASFNRDKTQHGREDSKVVRMDPNEAEGRERYTGDGDGNRSSSRANRQGDFIKRSRRITDSDGVILSEEQAEYFKNSKVVDNDGNLQVVYHGSKADATIFSERFISSWNMFGRGFYFTTSEQRAKGFAKGSLKECYVNIVNPFISNNEEHLALLYEEINNTKEDIDSYSEEKGIGGSEFFKICNYLDDIGKDVSQFIKELGFDGVLHYGYEDIEIVAYSSNQIKLTSNQTPTHSDDIRYSRRLTEGNNERSDEFRRIQEESLGMSDEESQRYRNGSKKISDDLFGRLSRIYRKEIHSSGSRDGNRYGVLNNTGDFVIYKDIEPTLFHDIFEINRMYLQYGELVDLHAIETTKNGIGYEDCVNYITDDGLSGFSITSNGDVISVFNMGRRRGFLRSISEVVKKKGRTLG